MMTSCTCAYAAPEKPYAIDQGAQSPCAPHLRPLKRSTTTGSTGQPALLLGGRAVHCRRLHHPPRGYNVPPSRKAHSPSTKLKQPTTTYSEASTAAPWMYRSHRLGSAAWPAAALPRGSRHSQPPAASPSPTQSSTRHSADASDCPSCRAAPPPSPDFVARPLPPPTRSMSTRAPPPIRFACCATMNSLK
jgi:hypothetical protein